MSLNKEEISPRLTERFTRVKMYRFVSRFEKHIFKETSEMVERFQLLGPAV